MPVINLYANLRKIAGTKRISVIGTTVKTALIDLIRQKPALDGFIIQNENIRPQVVITINGHNVSDLDTIINEQDDISIFPPIAGG